MVGNPNNSRRLQFAQAQREAEKLSLRAIVYIKRKELQLLNGDKDDRN